MFRKLLSLGALAAAFTLVLSTTDAQARHCRSHRHHCCQQNNNCGHQQANYGCQQNNNCGHQQANVGCQQTANVGCQQASCATVNTNCSPRPTCCGPQSACATQVIPASFSAPEPPLEQAAPAPAPGN